jgi:transposase
MAKMQNFTGIDVSKKTFDASYRENETIRTRKFDSTLSGMEAFIKWIPQGTQCVMESTGTYHLHLATFLHERGIGVSVVNPLSVKRFSQSLLRRAKTDRADSMMLVEYGEKYTPPLWKIPEAGYVEIRQLMRLYDQLMTYRGVMRNQLEALTNSVIRSPFMMQMLQEQIKQADENLKKTENRMEELAASMEKEAFEHLNTIPGIGRRTAAVLLAVTCGMKGFSSAKQVISYLGLCPRITTSGTSVKGKTAICKMGMASVRKLLYLCALSANRYNPACRELYRRLPANGKAKKTALIAVANKLLKQCFSIVKNNCTYEVDFHLKNIHGVNKFYEHGICT